MLLSEIKLNKRNPRKIEKAKLEKLQKSISEFEKMMSLRPIIVDENNIVLGGNMRYQALKGLGFSEIPDEWVKRAADLTDEEKRRFVVADNLGFGEWDDEVLYEDYNTAELIEWGMDIKIENTKKVGLLSERFGIPPLSVLNTQKDWWQRRKNSWLNLGIVSEIGRSDNDTKANDFKRLANKEYNINSIQDHNDKHGYISIFDPVLCELVYEWFGNRGFKVIDPFAGGSVRGIVASKKGLLYTGIDLSSKQIDANILQATELCNDVIPLYINADSLNIESYITDTYDLFFTCPPYVDLEVYSEDHRDLSTMSYIEFIDKYNLIIQKSTSFLNNDSFAVIVVGEVRNKNGAYYNFVGDTITAFINAGLKYYNEMILVTPVGSKALTIGSSFVNRKVGKVHQNVLVFVKGDPTKAAKRLGDCEFGEINQDFNNL